jgi:hypothetical protein
MREPQDDGRVQLLVGLSSQGRENALELVFGVVRAEAAKRHAKRLRELTEVIGTEELCVVSPFAEGQHECEIRADVPIRTQR